MTPFVCQLAFITNNRYVRFKINFIIGIKKKTANGANIKSKKFKSDDSKIASVSKKGVVMAKKTDCYGIAFGNDTIKNQYFLICNMARLLTNSLICNIIVISK